MYDFHNGHFWNLEEQNQGDQVGRFFGDFLKRRGAQRKDRIFGHFLLMANLIFFP
jgi:hypothetical protein